ncbi:MAG: DUF5320 domain-containing protein [Dehalococcoidia bacterium]|nr:DUF5320 domain-containing protein [Dehalococcoidia bacterium]
MPFGDGTGPMGLGPMTGRGRGFCTGFGRLGFAGPVDRRRLDWGWRARALPSWPRWGWGLGRGRGRGWWR